MAHKRIAGGIRPGGRLRQPDRRLETGSETLGGAQARAAGEPLALLVPQQPPEPLGVRRQRRQRRRPLEAALAMGAHPPEPAMLQMIDGRLDRRMLPARRLEPFPALARRSLGIRPALGRQRALVEQRAELGLIRRRVEAAVEAAGPKVGEPLHRPLDQRRRMAGVAALPHDPAVQDEPALVLDHGDRHAQLLAHAGLALGHPAGVRLEDRERLLAVRDGLAPEQPPRNLLELAARMAKIALELARQRVLAGRQRPAPASPRRARPGGRSATNTARPAQDACGCASTRAPGRTAS